MACFLLVIFAQGGPPLLTDDPGTPGDGKWEINLAVTLESTEEGDRFEAPLIDINCGVGERIQLKLELPWVVLDESGASTRAGLGNALFGFKWRFLDEETSGVSISLYPQVGLNLLDSSQDRGLVERGNELFLPIQLQRDLGFLEVNLELGYAIRESRDDEWIFGMALGKAILERFELIGEIHATVNPRFESADAVFHVGFRAKVSDLNTLLFAVGRGLTFSSDEEPRLSIYVGFQFNF